MGISPNHLTLGSWWRKRFLISQMAIYCYSCCVEASVTAFGIGQRLFRLFAAISTNHPPESQVHFCLFVRLSCCHILTQTQASRFWPTAVCLSFFILPTSFFLWLCFVPFRMVHSILLAALAFGPAFVSIKQIPLSANECTCCGRARLLGVGAAGAGGVQGCKGAAWGPLCQHRLKSGIFALNN